MKEPKLRFKAEDGNCFPKWEEYTIDEIATCFAGATPSTKIPEYWENGTIRWMSSGEVNKGQIYDTEKKISQLGFDNCSTKIVKPNTVVMALAGQGKTRGTVGITRVPLCTNQSLCAIETNTNINDDYLYQYLQTQYKNLRLISSGDGTRGGLNLKLIGEYPVKVPNPSEQQKIASLFSELDNLVQSAEKELDGYRELKQGMLQKMFPKKGEKVPEIRFSEFTGNWELCKLGDIGSVSMCRRIFKEQTTESGDIPFYKIGTFGGKADAYISKDLFEEYKAKYPFPKVGDILISASGSIGRTVEFNGESAYFQDSNIVWLNHDERVDNSFLKQFYSIVKWSGLEGSTIKRLYNDNILKTEISLPSLDEQQKIGSYFSNLDNLIASQQQELDGYKELKKGLLQQMFC